ncbi:hypothetical protein Vafri_19877, partial [Volvox africanus]
MQQPHGSTLRVVRLPAADSGYNLCASAQEVVLARALPLLSGHVGLVDRQGVYHIAKLGEGDSRASVAAVYELQLCTGPGFHRVSPVRHSAAPQFPHIPASKTPKY